MLQLNKTKTGNYLWMIAPTNNNSYFSRNNDEFKNDYICTVYNRRVVSSTISSSLGLSVIGIYISIVYVAGSSIRSTFDRYSEKAMYEERP